MSCLGFLSGRFFAGLSVAFLLVSSSAHGGNYVYRFNNTFSGTSPEGPAPWFEAYFSDIIPGTVSLTISNNGLTGTEFISGLYFNLNTNFNATSLSFQLMGGSANSSPENIWTGRDQFKADGDGKYDILLDFGTTSSHRFDAGDFLVYRITGISTLNALDFQYLSAPAGGKGPFLAAAHIQSIGCNDDSGWVRPSEFSLVTPVPEPSTAALLGVGLLAWGVIFRSGRYARNRS